MDHLDERPVQIRDIDLRRHAIDVPLGMPIQRGGIARAVRSSL
jgi:hypothetical protein